MNTVADKWILRGISKPKNYKDNYKFNTYTSCLGKSFDFIKHEFVSLLILNNHIQVSFNAVISCPLGDGWLIWYYDSYQVVLERISIDKYLLNVNTHH